jgi:hypothetical protein
VKEDMIVAEVTIEMFSTPPFTQTFPFIYSIRLNLSAQQSITCDIGNDLHKGISKANHMTSRRDFIRTGLTGSAGIAIGGLGFSASSYARIKGSNERINLAVIGTGTQGKAHINSWCRLKDSRNLLLKTICDTDEQLWPEPVKTITDKTGHRPATEWDMRKVFDDKDIHAVSFATPNHWHALGTIWACQAGKHVYVEKPVSHNIYEGRKMIEAANKYKVRVQSGLQNRSIANVRQAIQFLHDGGIGKVYAARGLCYSGWAPPPGALTMKRKVTITGTGIGTLAAVIQATRARTSSILRAGD